MAKKIPTSYMDGPLLLRRTKLHQIGRPVEIVKKIGLNGVKKAEQLDISLASGK